jgi:hypothetical protein
MKVKSTIATFVASLLLVGCSAVKQTNQTQPAINLTGDWQFTLNENQDDHFIPGSSAGNTLIDIALTQNGSTLTAQTTPEPNGIDVLSQAWIEFPGCGVPPNERARFNWDTSASSEFSGSQTGRSFTSQMMEAENDQGANSGSVEGAQLTLTGTINSDGTISGSLNDGCTKTQGVTFQAVRIATKLVDRTLEGTSLLALATPRRDPR